jgi:membrane protein required for colicin V production
MNWLDIILLAVVLLTLILGLIKGFIKEIVGIIAVVLGLLLAAHSYGAVSRFFQQIIRNELISNFLGFLAIFFGVLIIGGLVSFLLSKLMKGPLKLANHLLGGAFGLLKGILISGVLVFAMLTFNMNRDVLMGSRLAPYCFGITKALVYLIPQELKTKFRTSYQELVGKGGSDGQKI